MRSHDMEVLKMNNIDYFVDKWTEDCFRLANESKDICQWCGKCFYNDGVQYDDEVFCSFECLKECVENLAEVL